jgi:hypothetical protein
MTKLSDIPPKNPFKVPDNYFDEVNRKIISGAQHSVRRISIYHRFRTHLLIAASVAGLIILSYGTVRLINSERSKSIVSELMSNINPDSLVNDIDISSIEESASTMTIPNDSLDVSKKDIIDYLIKENIEINEIYERF